MEVDLEETDELFPLTFYEDELPVIVILLMFHTFMADSDESKSRETKKMVAETGKLIYEAIKAAPKNEPLPLPFEGLTLLYYAYMAAVNIARTPNVKDAFGKMMLVTGMKHGPADIDAFLARAKKIGQREVDFINKNYGDVPLVKTVIQQSETTWRAVAEQRKKDGYL